MSLQQLDSETGWSMEPLYCQLRHHYVITFMRIFWEVVGKDSGAGRDWGQEEKGTTEDEMAGWHHWLDGRWVWVNSRTWWWTGRPGVLRFMGSQRVGRNWATELNWRGFNMGFSKARSSPSNEYSVLIIFPSGLTGVLCHYWVRSPKVFLCPDSSVPR